MRAGATIFFAVIDLVAAVGLWLAAAWGGVVWLTASISMAAIELFFRRSMAAHLDRDPEFIAIAIYIALALMAGRDGRTSSYSTRRRTCVPRRG